MEPSGRPSKVRTYYRVFAGPENPEYAIQNNDITNLTRGLVERVYRVESGGNLVCPPQPAPGHFANTLAQVRRQILRVMPTVQPVSYDEFVAMYQGRRRTIYEEATTRLLRRGLVKSDAYLSTFVKCEKVNLTKKADPAPRVIQPRQPTYNVALGVFLKPMEHLLYRAIADLWGGPTVMKGYNAADTAKHLRNMWTSFREPVALLLDATRFDQHVSVPALEWEHSVYLACVGASDRPLLRRLLRMQIKNKGFANLADGRIKYQVDGHRMSGDMNTATGNCLLMSCMVKAYMDSLNVRAKLANNGDDCALFIERKDAALVSNGLSQWFLQMGFNMKMGPLIDEFERVEFCQTYPLDVGDGWVMVRDPRLCIAKDLVSSLPMEQGTSRYAWATAVGECGLSLSGGVPILQEFYSSLIRAGLGVRHKQNMLHESGFFRLAYNMSRSYSPIHWRARYSFWRSFGVSPSDQVAIEEYYRCLAIDLTGTLGKAYDPTFPSYLING